MQKIDYFMRFFKKIIKPCVKFSRFGRKTKLVGKFLRKISKLSCENSKNALFLDYSQQNFQSPALNYRAFWQKNNCLGNFWENFQKFIEEIAKMHYFSLFSAKFKKPCVNFSRVWTKNTNCWVILRKFWNFLIKIH